MKATTQFLFFTCLLLLEARSEIQFLSQRSLKERKLNFKEQTSGRAFDPVDLPGTGTPGKHPNQRTYDRDSGSDPKCERGLPDRKRNVCCSAECWNCESGHPLCNKPEEYFAGTGQKANECCVTEIMSQSKEASCDEGVAPCRLNVEFKKEWEEEELLPINAERHKKNEVIVKQREFRVILFDEVKKKYDTGIDIANSVYKLTNEKVTFAEAQVKKFRELLGPDYVEAELMKVNGTAKAHGPINDAVYVAGLELNLDEARFYGMIRRNAEWVAGNGTQGLARVDDMKVGIQVNIDRIDRYEVEVEELHNDAKRVKKDADMLWQQWQNSAKTFNCTPHPTVEHHKTLCKELNTFVRRCPRTCIIGYDSNESKNSLRCLKQGKFGKELYGELSGIATCVGRNCGKPPAINQSTTVIQDIRFPNVAAYTCFEGHSMDGSAGGNKTFNLPCGNLGKFLLEPTHKCIPVRCGASLNISNAKVTNPQAGYVYAQVVKYKCDEGYTNTGAAGGVTEYEIRCQATGEFTQPQKCLPVRCGPAPSYVSTKMLTAAAGDQFFPKELKYSCDTGYSLNQKCGPDTAFTLKCDVSGEFIWKEGSAGAPIPVCRAVSAGMAPTIKFGTFQSREMFYGESAAIVAEVGYSTASHPDNGLQFTIAATDKCGYSGVETFKPVDCGAPPAPANSKHSFQKETAVFQDFVSYVCTNGYSTDASKSEARQKFTIQCEADGTYSKIPGTGECVNIDDCKEHTCGAFGHCVDKLLNYSCACLDGYEEQYDENAGERVCGNIDDCGPEACGVGECKDGLNDYECICPSGYEQIETGEGKTCTAVTCGTPPRVEHALTQPVSDGVSKSFYKETVLFHCATGYTITGKHADNDHFKIDCQADRSFTATEACKPIECGNAPTVANARANGATAVFNQSIKYECNEGYSIDKTPNGDAHFSVVCQDTGAYGLPLECLPITCGEPDQVANAQRPSGKRNYGDVVPFACFEGYTIDGVPDSASDFTARCQANGQFTSLETCNPKICGHPPKNIFVLHATVPDVGNLHYPQVAEITCRDGYTIGGDARGNTSFLIKCKSAGEFEKPATDCEPVKCGALPAMANATLSEVTDTATGKVVDVNALTFGLKAQYGCKPGFTAGGEHDAVSRINVECFPNGAFSLPAPDLQCRNVNDCDRHTCGAHGSCVDEIGPSPAYTCDCQHGYELRTKPNGEKHCGDIDDCGSRECGPGVCRDLVGDYTCICPSGHYLAKVDGEKTCLPVRCADEPETVANAKLLTNHQGPVDFPATLTYQCDTGYSTDSSPVEAKTKFQASCKAHGKLMGMMSCQPVSCGAPHMFVDTALIFPANKRALVTYPQSAKYKCEEGHSILGAPDGKIEYETKCLSSGVLSDPEVCEPIKCGTAPRMSKCRASLAGVVLYGQVVQYECDKGHSLTGVFGGGHHFTRKCEKDGAFEASDAECKPMNAGAVPSVENAAVMQYAGRAVEAGESLIAYYPQGIEYKCNPGYSLTGTLAGQTKFVTQVNAEGKFMPAIPAKCKIIAFKVAGEVKDARTGSSLVGAVVQVQGTDNGIVTDQGFFALTDVAPGQLKLLYSKEGFISTSKTITVAGDVHSGGVADINMSPKLEETSWRAALQWSDYPPDLDTYVQWSTNKVYWANKYGNSNIRARLEVDDVDGEGPETAFLSGVGTCEGDAYKCDIKYMINDYDQTADMLSRSGAGVTLYNGDRVAGTWKIADCPNAVSQDGNWWHVFTINSAKGVASADRVKWHCGMPDSSGASVLMHVGGKVPQPISSNVDFESYVGPFPGRFLRNRHKHKGGKQTEGAQKKSAEKKTLRIKLMK